MAETIITIILCGAGTFLLRFIPIWRARRKQSTAIAPAPVQAFLRGIGPAAITALLLVSLWPMLANDAGTGLRVPTLAALAVIYVVKRRFGGIAAPTLTGALAYGAFVWFLTP